MFDSSFEIEHPVLNNNRFKVLLCEDAYAQKKVALQHLLHAATEGRNKTIWFVVPTFKIANRDMRKDLWDMFDKGSIVTKEYSDMRIGFMNGTEITIKGCDDICSLKGDTLDYIVWLGVDEVPINDLYNVLRPSLADRLGSAVYIGGGNPHIDSEWASMITYSQFDPDYQSWEVKVNVWTKI